MCFHSLVSSSRILTIAVVVLAIVAISGLAYNQYVTLRDSYNSEIKVSYFKSQPAYDYSCGSPDYQIYFTIANTGEKKVVDLSISLSNPLCVGSLPTSLPTALNASSTVSFVAQSTSANGTLTISGNNTFLQVKF